MMIVFAFLYGMLVMYVTQEFVSRNRIREWLFVILLGWLVTPPVLFLLLLMNAHRFFDWLKTKW